MRKLAAIFICAVTIQPVKSSFAETKAHTDNPSHFIGIEKFSRFQKETSGNEIILTSPEIKTPMAWDELVVSWNATAGAHLKIEARGIYPDRATKFYTMGLWSEDASKFPRESVRREADADGKVSTDTLILSNLCEKTQIRITLGSADKSAEPKLKFLGLHF
jgi:hypothetical protein